MGFIKNKTEIQSAWLWGLSLGAPLKCLEGSKKEKYHKVGRRSQDKEILKQQRRRGDRTLEKNKKNKGPAEKLFGKPDICFCRSELLLFGLTWFGQVALSVLST